MTFELHANPRQVLEEILQEARRLGPRAVLAFDLDSTILDNRPRQVRILRELGAARNLAVLTAHDESHWSSGWDLKGAMVAAGLPAEEAERLLPEAKAFWKERFFTSEYSELDRAVPGAAEYLRYAVATGASVAYLTGRHVGMRRGTVVVLSREGMPLPGGMVHLIMKPAPDEADDAFKLRAQGELRDIGQVIAAFDNEPTHANGYRRSFPEARVVHLATDHSGRPVALLPGIVSIPDFRR